MKKSVLIIGGGMAGLAAARILVKHGIATTIIEAKDRLGGRIHTVKEGNALIELGAEFVHGHSQALLSAIQEAKLSTQTVASRNQVFKHGKFETLPLWQLVGDVFNQIDARERDCSFDEFLEQQSFDSETRKIACEFVEGFDAAQVSRISTQALLRAEIAAEQMEGSDQLRVVEGYGALVRFLEKEIVQGGGRLMKGTRVRQIDWKHHRVEVAVENRDERLQAEAALVTLPLGILKTGQVTFAPPLPANKVDAIGKMQFGNVIKIIFQFRDTFWDGRGFLHAFDEPIPTWWGDQRGPVIVGWAGGSKAEALLNCSSAQLETLGLDILAKMFAQSPARLRDQLVAFHFWNWAQDPDIGGAYSYIPVNGLDLPMTLAQPVDDTLFFAGEAIVADAQTGTVFGALESGQRAAREILMD
jgi:monoamine oxidase